jgi:hypothetical protein
LCTPLFPLTGQQQLITSVTDRYKKANCKRAVVIIVKAAEEVGTPALRDLLGALLLVSEYQCAPGMVKFIDASMALLLSISAA